MEHKIDNGHVNLPRFRMEQAVDPTSVELVTKSLPGLSGPNDFVIIDPQYYHNTIINLARAGTIFRHLKREVQEVELEHYAHQMQLLRERLILIRSGVMGVPGERFDIYGNGQKVFVLKLRLTPELRELHMEAYEGVSELLKRCGVLNPRRFMERVYGLYYSTPQRFKPHVSFARKAGRRRLPIEAKDLMVVLYPAKVLETHYERVSHRDHPDCI